MTGENKRTLPSPLAMHSAEPRKPVSQPLSYYRKNILLFGIVQALVVMFVTVLYAFRLFFPSISEIRTLTGNALSNANFSKVTYNKGQLEFDIKPTIWTYQLKESGNTQYILVIDSTGNLNRFFWDDVIIDGGRVSRCGLTLRKDSFVIKNGTTTKAYPYKDLSFLGIKEGMSLSKSEVNTKIDSLLSKQNFIVVLSVIVLLVGIIAYIVGISAHLLFGLLIGFLVNAFSTSDRDPQDSVKIALAAYVPYFCILALMGIGVLVIDVTMPVMVMVVIVKLILLPLIVFLLYGYMRNSDNELMVSVGRKSSKVKKDLK